jgi:hypothetical protein
MPEVEGREPQALRAGQLKEVQGFLWEKKEFPMVGEEFPMVGEEYSQEGVECFRKVAIPVPRTKLDYRTHPKKSR